MKKISINSVINTADLAVIAIFAVISLVLIATSAFGLSR